jgi:Tfp pilus assembly protein PilX
MALALLAVLTALGLSAMQATLMEQLMVGNAYFQARAFHGAYGEIRAQTEHLRRDTRLLAAADVQPLVLHPRHSERGLRIEAVLTSAGQGYVSGYSVKTVVGRYYELDSTAKVHNTGAGSSQTQGLLQLAPQ